MTTATASALRPFVPRLAAAWQRDRGDEIAQVLDASLLGLDISGFTALSERLAERGKLGAEELITLISRCYSGLIEIGRRYGGDVLKFRGDALLLSSTVSSTRNAPPARRSRCRRSSGSRERASRASGRCSSGWRGVVSGACHFFLVGHHHRSWSCAGRRRRRRSNSKMRPSRAKCSSAARTAAALRGSSASERDGAFLLRSEPTTGAAAAPRRAGAPGTTSRPSCRRHCAMLDRRRGDRGRAQAGDGGVREVHRHGPAGRDASSGAAALSALGDVVSADDGRARLTWLESDIDGDGGKLYLVAGAPASAGDDEERMLRAARADRRRRRRPADRRRREPRPRARRPDRLARAARTYAVMGDTVNLAARLAARAATGRDPRDGRRPATGADRFDTTSRQFLMKGKSKPVTGPHGRRAIGEAVEEPGRSLPLVGREQELAKLVEAVNAVRMRRAAPSRSSASRASGKSRLVEELTERRRLPDSAAHCEPYSSSTPFGPLRGCSGR